LAVGLGAIILAKLATWPLEIRLGWSLGEGAGLALASTLGFIELLAERFDLRLQIGKATL
jgi:hypothetical protein